jgi:hypothetical protein
VESWRAEVMGFKWRNGGSAAPHFGSRKKTEVLFSHNLIPERIPELGLGLSTAGDLAIGDSGDDDDDGALDDERSVLKLEGTKRGFFLNGARSSALSAATSPDSEVPAFSRFAAWTCPPCRSQAWLRSSRGARAYLGGDVGGSRVQWRRGSRLPRRGRRGEHLGQGQGSWGSNAARVALNSEVFAVIIGRRSSRGARLSTGPRQARQGPLKGIFGGECLPAAGFWRQSS